MVLDTVTNICLKTGGEKLLRMLLRSRSGPLPILLSNAKACLQQVTGEGRGGGEGLCPF